jgi:hypothetical protein
MNCAFIDRIETESTGGHTMVDFVILKDGRVLGISDDCVCLYKSIDDFWDATPETKPTIEL